MIFVPNVAGSLEKRKEDFSSHADLTTQKSINFRSLSFLKVYLLLGTEFHPSILPFPPSSSLSSNILHQSARCIFGCYGDARRTQPPLPPFHRRGVRKSSCGEKGK
ncbi:hypothetical protein NPIL_236361 [Nephila pilipes]|uniref:Uncharacterized protein n=1 Tax=Nephila pilipes TaxID=299642 RepID=A0A8X6N4R1_NEPPI|nr:hypothetical protein NPIL_236361 [Nephila pilipes]